MFYFFTSHPQYQFYLNLGVGLLIILAFIVFKKIVNKSLLKLVSKIDSRTSSLIEDFNTSLKRPLEYWWLATGLYIGIGVSPFVSTPKLTKPALILSPELAISLDFISSEFLTNVYTAVVIVLITWAACNLVNFYEKFLISVGSKFNLFDNSLLIKFSGKVIKLTFIVIGTFASISPFIGPLTGVLTSVGFAGAAVTFIAKDTLTDVLSGIVLMIDKPFTIGDWIQINTLEGIVEDVSFRSTRIRTFTQGLVVVPNSTLSDNNITNWSAMSKRRVSFDLGFTYSTSREKMQLAIKEIEKLLANHPQVETETSLVYFSTFADSSLNVTVIYFSLALDLAGYSKLKEIINLEIMDILSQNDLDIAFPTQSVWLEQPEVL
ncbi:MAG: mechanosensitive ion channel family protein [Cellulosilyticaceae bacterium]